jgi:hypothetical protein
MEQTLSGRAGPDIARAIGLESPNIVEVLFSRQAGDTALTQAAEAIPGGTKKNVSILPLADGVNGEAGKAVLTVENAKSPVFKPAKTASSGSNPEVAFAVLKQGGDEIAGQAVVFGEILKRSVRGQADEAVAVIADPKVSGAVLVQDTIGGVRQEAVSCALKRALRRECEKLAPDIGDPETAFPPGG